jgi:hypothetical protein
MGRPRMDVADRITARTCVDPVTDCWEWQGAKGANGYGRIRVTEEFGVHRVEMTHRAAYAAFVGPIPEGLHLDHLCRNRICCNPAHLEPVTSAENVLRGDAPSARNARATRCVAGHEFTPENTYALPGGGRYCRECGRRRSREYLARKAASSG